MRQERKLFDCWRDCKAEKIKWQTFQKRIAPIREETRGLLLHGKFIRNKKLIGFCNELYDRRAHLWTFTKIEGIEPTNNAGDRALRPAVIYRKLSFGTQSAHGSRYIERLLSVSETCRVQPRNAYQYLVEAMEAKFAGEAAPSLLPTKSATTVAAAWFFHQPVNSYLLRGRFYFTCIRRTGPRIGITLYRLGQRNPLVASGLDNKLLSFLEKTVLFSVEASMRYVLLSVSYSFLRNGLSKAEEVAIMPNVVHRHKVDFATVAASRFPTIARSKLLSRKKVLRVH